MRVYILYRIGDYAVPIAMSFSKEKITKYMSQRKRNDKHNHVYFIESRIVSEEVIDISEPI